MTTFTLAGIVSAPVLPMLPDSSIDWTSLQSYIRWIAEQRPTAIAMNMDASEGPSLEADEQMESHGIKILVDNKSLLYLEGTEIDYRDEGPLRQGFVF